MKPSAPRSSLPSAFRPLGATLAAGCWLLVAGGCMIEAGTSVDTETRVFSESFPDTPGQTLRLANLAGTVELVAGEGDQVVIETTVHARGRDAAETRRLLAEMRWEESRDEKGRVEWVLTYPVDRYRRFHYNGDGWSSANRVRYRDRRVRLSTRKSAGAPTLYADLRISYPGGGGLRVDSGMGDIRGARLEGSLDLDTGSGDIHIEAVDGELIADTGSGDIELGVMRGESRLDTGSGEVRVEDLVGNSVIDTGSGDVEVRRVALGRLVVDTGSGDILVERGSVNELSLDTGSGSVQVLGVEVVRLEADTGSGDVVLETPLDGTEKVEVDTGSGDVRIRTSPSAAFDIDLSSGSGELLVRFDDAELRKIGGRVTGARRGQGGARIHVETGSGDCVIGPG